MQPRIRRGVVRIAAFYRFTPFADPGALRAPLEALCAAEGVTGTLLLAPEGINATVAGRVDAVEALLAHVRALPGCEDLRVRESVAEVEPFGRMKVRLKREIVTMGRPDVDPLAGVGRRVAPGAWNAVLADPDTVAVDVRNAFEVAIGSFEGAEDPGTAAFGDFPGWWEANRARLAGRRVAMFCTGGIRCEKSTAMLAAEGVDVVHLDGGILGYLEAVPEARSRWRGGCFVFDDRVSVGHGLVPDGHVLCHACRRPLAPADTDRPEFEAGVACHLCAAEFDAADRARFRERMRQIGLARARGGRHLGRIAAP